MTAQLNDVNRLMRRPCNVEQMQQEWPKIIDYLRNSDITEATTTAAWHKGGGSPYVMTDLGRVDLPVHPSRDWNIPSGWPVRVKKIPGGFQILDDLLDDKIGTIKLWGIGTSVPTGWGKMNGTDNSTGTGYDMTGKYVKGNGTVGTTGGSTSYTPGGTITGGGSTSTSSATDTFTTDEATFSGSASTSTDTINLSGLYVNETVVAEHGLHYHTVRYETVQRSDASGSLKDTDVFDGAQTSSNSFDYSTFTRIPTDEGWDSGTFPSGPGTDDFRTHTAHSHITGSTASGAAGSDWDAVGSHYHTFDASVVDHDHSGTTDGHTHTIDTSGLGFTGTGATIEPPFVQLFYIERLDNSSG